MREQAMSNQLVDNILELIMAECKYWHGRDEARRGGFATLYAAAKALNDEASSAHIVSVVPDGYALVRIEPTPEMINACLGETGAASGYKAMLAASPTAKEVEL
jgi:hypothetical protein